jgi:II/X family phage/plasmid replication protein
MIDWLTLRLPLNQILRSDDDDLIEKFSKYLGLHRVTNSTGELVREKYYIDVDALRSDEVGLFWQIQHNGIENHLIVAGSPASVEHGTNVFGSNDLMHCARFMHGVAQKALDMILPSIEQWQLMRLDFNYNYLLESNAQVKQALRELAGGHGIRQKSSNDNGDTVDIGKGSAMISGVIYDKGTQIEKLQKKLVSKGQEPIYESFEIEIMKRFLRLELRLKRQWFEKLKHKRTITTYDKNGVLKQGDYDATPRGLKAYKKYYESVQPWTELTEEDLISYHEKYFKPFTGSIEMKDMGDLLQNLKNQGLSDGQARMCFQTWLSIKEYGYEQVKANFNKSTFSKHRAWLIKAGLTHTDLQNSNNSNVLIFKRRTIELTQPVTSWSEVLRLVA